MSLESQQMAGMAKIGKRLSQQMSGLQMLNWHMSGQCLNFSAFELFDETFSKFIFSWKSRLKTWRVSPLGKTRIANPTLLEDFYLNFHMLGQFPLGISQLPLGPFSPFEQKIWQNDRLPTGYKAFNQNSFQYFSSHFDFTH